MTDDESTVVEKRTPEMVFIIPLALALLSIAYLSIEYFSVITACQNEEREYETSIIPGLVISAKCAQGHF
jgi:hypothetical protein